MDLVPTQNANTAQEYFSREDMSPVLHRMKIDVITSSTAPKPGNENTKVAKSLNFVPVNKCDIKVLMYFQCLGLGAVQEVVTSVFIL